MSEFTHRLSHQSWTKPSRNETEYFRREEFRSRMEAARARDAMREAAERERWIERHGNHCPKCGGELEPLTTEIQNGDQCPGCLGVWMDWETFDRLTHPDEKNEFLTGIFREFLLQWTTGRLNPHERKRRKSPAPSD